MRSVLVVNAGSSSLKYQLLDVDAGASLAGGLIERIGADNARAEHRGSAQTLHLDGDLADHESALRWALAAFADGGDPLEDAGLIAVGHRVVHGGTAFDTAAVVDQSVRATIEEFVPLAPLHQPANLLGLDTGAKVLGHLPQVAVFDTAFHQTIPAAASTYALDREVASRYRIRKYGFHGTSHAYVSAAAATFLQRPLADVNTIVLHLGNGASACAVAGGRSIDTSMGLTPLDGLVMGTRTGSIDPAVAFLLIREAGMTAGEVDDLMNKRSGMLGLAGVNDLREVHAAAALGDDQAAQALEVYAYRVRSFVGAYAAALGRVDAIAFTAGVGENDGWVRSASLAGLQSWGISVDPDLNAARGGGTRYISPPGAAVAVIVVPTNEELEIARQTAALIG